MKRINNLFLLSFVGLNLLSCSTNSNMNINKPSIEEEIISPSIEDEIISPSIEDEIIDETLSEQVSDFIEKDENQKSKNFHTVNASTNKTENKNQTDFSKKRIYWYIYVGQTGVDRASDLGLTKQLKGIIKTLPLPPFCIDCLASALF